MHNGSDFESLVGLIDTTLLFLFYHLWFTASLNLNLKDSVSFGLTKFAFCFQHFHFRLRFDRFF